MQHSDRSFFLGILFAMLVVFPYPVWSAVQLVLETENEQVIVGEEFSLTLRATTSDGEQVDDVKVPEVPGASLEGTSQSQGQSTRLITGPGGMKYERTTIYEFTYSYRPSKAGLIRIPGFQVVIDGKPVTSNGLQVFALEEGSVRKGQPSVKGRAQPPNPFEDDEDLFNQLLQRRGIQPTLPSQNPPKNPKEMLNVQVEVDKKEAFEGEQILVQWYVYTRGNLVSMDRVKFPDLRGFWKEIIEEVPALNFVNEVVNGVAYRKALLASHALFPIKAGTSVIDEYKVKGAMQVPSQVWGAFNMGRTYTFNRSSERVRVTVKPLPTEGKPANFSGAVGQFEAQAILENAAVPAQQPFSLKVRFEGRGNAKLIELPAFDLPPGLELYDTKTESKFFRNGSSYKEFEVLMIPRQQGDMTIPEIEYSVFDPAQEKYVSKKTEPLNLKVTAAVQTQSGESRLQAQQEKAGPSLPLPFASAQPSFSLAQAAQNARPYIWFLAIAGMLASLLMQLYRIRQMDSGTFNFASEIDRRAKKIQKSMTEKDSSQVSSEILNLIYFTLANLAGGKGAFSETHKLLDQLSPTLRKEFGDSLQAAIQRFQALSFSFEKEQITTDKLRQELTLLTTLLKQAAKKSVLNDEKNR